jgi:hypothetical protein
LKAKVDELAHITDKVKAWDLVQVHRYTKVLVTILTLYWIGGKLQTTSHTFL